jgi:hypothetical protein
MSFSSRAGCVTRKYQYGKEEVTTFCVPAPVQQVAVCYQRQETASDDNEPVTLSVIVRISFNDYFFTADGFYRGPSRFTSSLADVKPSFVKEKCNIQPFKTDFTLLRWPQIWNGYEMPYLRQELMRSKVL